MFKIMLTGIMLVLISLFILGVIIINAAHGSPVHSNMELASIIFLIGGVVLFGYGLFMNE